MNIRNVSRGGSKRAMKPTGRLVAALLCGAALSGALGIAVAEAPSGDPIAKELPRRFLGTIAVTSPTGWKTERVEIVVERWTKPEERDRMLTVLADKGDFGLAEVMREYDVGFVRIGMDSPWRLRSAAIWPVEGGFKVRVATERPINFAETFSGARSQDYPIGIVELFVKDDGEGQGGILVASQVRFDKEGRLEVKALPNSTGPHKITKVREAEPKKTKKSEKSE